MENIQSISWYEKAFETFGRSLNGDRSSWVHAMRERAMEHLRTTGLPTTHNEDWKYTSVAPIAKTNFTPLFGYEDSGITNDTVDKNSFLGIDRIVFIDGFYSQKFSQIKSIPNGIKISSLADALKSDKELVQKNLGSIAHVEQEAFTALNTAFIQDGAFISIPDDTTLSSPLHILCLASGRETAFAVHPRNLIIIGANSNISIIESFVGSAENSYFTNAVTEILIGENATVEHYKLQNESAKGFHIGSLAVQQNRGSKFSSTSVALGGSLVRNNVLSVLNAEGCDSTLNGLTLAHDDQHIDNHIFVDHGKPHCTSHQLYKTILDDRSRGVFDGKIFVHKDAQKTDARQSSKTLLLSELAQIDAKPQLEIFADDVKCSHGATVGQLDDEALFYLRSRGIGVERARSILTYAFASDLISRITIDPLREYLDEILHEKLERP